VRFSSRVDTGSLNPIAQAELQAKSDGIALHKLNDSNPTKHGLAPDCLPRTYDAEPRGPLSARTALADFLFQRSQDAVNPENLYLLSSTSQAYSWLMKLLCDPGDAVLSPKPGYPLIESIGHLENVETLEYQLRFDGSWFIDTSELERILDSPTGRHIKALIVINPNNPSGSYIKPNERKRIVELCKEHEVALIADEVFFEYTLEPFDGNVRVAGESGVLTFSLDGFSKMLAAPHAKVGWIEVSGPEEDVRQAQRRLDVIADDYLPMSDIIAERIPDLLHAVPEQTQRVLKRVHGNLSMLHTMIDGDPNGLVSVLRAEGGWNVLLRVPSVIDENELVLALIRESRLSGQPGYFFDMTSNGYLAVSLLPERKEFAANIRAVLDTVNTLLG
jgi:aspartate/methionine/tyrosine aminotransferase